MAASAKLMAIRYADKVAFVITLGLLGYVVTTSFVFQDTSERQGLQEIGRLQAQVQRNLSDSRPNGEIEKVDLTAQLKARFIQVPDAAEIRPFIFVRPSPLIYDQVALSQGEKQWIDMREELVVDSQPAGSCIKIVQRKGKRLFLLGMRAGEASIKGLDPKGMTHEIPIVVSEPKAKVTVSAPTGLAYDATLGQIALSWTPSAVAPAQAVTQVDYEVWRKHEAETDFSKMHTVSSPSCVDPTVKSGELYSYKVIGVAQTADGPVKSEFSDTAQATAKSSVEFSMLSAARGSALFDVRVFDAGAKVWHSKKFSVAVGGLIGEYVHRLGVPSVDYSTGCALVDIMLNSQRMRKHTTPKKIFDRSTGQPLRVEQIVTWEPETLSKAIYQDRKGNPKTAWQDKGASRSTTPKRPPTVAPKADEAPAKAAGSGQRKLIEEVQDNP